MKKSGMEQKVYVGSGMHIKIACWRRKLRKSLFFLFHFLLQKQIERNKCCIDFTNQNNSLRGIFLKDPHLFEIGAPGQISIELFHGYTIILNFTFGYKNLLDK